MKQDFKLVQEAVAAAREILEYGCLSQDCVIHKPEKLADQKCECMKKLLVLCEKLPPMPDTIPCKTCVHLGKPACPVKVKKAITRGFPVITFCQDYKKQEAK